MSGALHSLNSEDILRSGASNNEGKKLRKLHCPFESDPAFHAIWAGGFPSGVHLSLKLQVATDHKGRLLYNGRLYNRDSWTWQPPKFIRLQGRHAKDIIDFRNYPAKAYIITQKGDVIELDACICGGELLYDHNEELYCSACGAMY